MKNAHNIVLLVTLLITASTGVFQATAQDDKQKRPKISISSYDIYIQVLTKPRIIVDAKGQQKSYTKAYVVRLKGYFAVDRAIPVDVYIGDYKIPEYGGTKDGIYFKVYDEKLLQKLDNQAFGIGLMNQKIQTLKLKFQLRKKRPFKIFEEKDGDPRSPPEIEK